MRLTLWLAMMALLGGVGAAWLTGAFELQSLFGSQPPTPDEVAADGPAPDTLAEEPLPEGRARSTVPQPDAGFPRGACGPHEAAECYRMARELLSRGGHEAERASDMLDEACHAGEPRACVHLGRALLDGDGVPLAPERGRALLQQACAGGSTLACDELGH